MCSRIKINRDLVITRFNKLDQILENLRELKEMGKEEFLSNYKNYFTAQRALEISINICIDIGNHIVTLNNKEKPETFTDIMKILAKNEIISDELENQLTKMVRFRNLLGHFYLEIDNEIIYNILQNNLKDFNSFKETILRKFKDDLLGDLANPN
ncbi:hypothetical protein LCGC14_1199860 [marine sediment metagenome]|uniref:DUF86 domain-containing protein n=1 Tax=marine sediment metagenome TaxID=412755 RepID=A0A0F9M4N6_9ZZZZ|nr:MAG: hypothetical protein Lokiarch_31610 [Candidatus Lokiarchaeum sp. GC14_75]